MSVEINNFNNLIEAQALKEETHLFKKIYSELLRIPESKTMLEEIEHERNKRFNFKIGLVDFNALINVSEGFVELTKTLPYSPSFVRELNEVEEITIQPGEITYSHFYQDSDTEIILGKPRTVTNTIDALAGIYNFIRFLKSDNSARQYQA